MASIKKFNGTSWSDSNIRKYGTATDTLTTLPADIYADGSNATVGLEGNMTQNGTPSPENPITPSECGELEATGEHAGQYKLPITSAGQSTNIYLGEVETTRRIGKIDLGALSWTRITTGLWRTTSIPNIKYVSQNTEIGGGLAEKYTMHTGSGMFTALNCIAIDVSQVSVNTGSDSENPSGMFWYVLVTPETGIVNEPIRKIGEYADTVSGVAIPTITGKDTFDVDTTLKPSAAELTYTGWHDAEVKEWDGSQWQ